MPYFLAVELTPEWVGVILSILGGAGVLGAAFRRIQQLEKQVEHVEKKADANRAALGDINTKLASMNTDVRWIRKTIERLDPSDQTQPPPGGGH